MIYFLFFVTAFIVYFEEEVKKYAFEVYKFIEFIHENNPLLLHYYNYENENEYLDFYEEQQEQQEQKESEKVELYENKYLTRFKDFTNEYLFNEQDLEYEKNQFERMRIYHNSLIVSFEKQILTDTSKLNQLVCQEDELLKKYPNGEMEKIDDEYNKTNDDDYENDDLKIYNDYEQLCDLRERITDKRNKLEKILNDLMILKEKTEEELKEEARTNMIENKLNEFVNNYIIEYTPVGNVIMRFNNNKKSFEYYSNNSIPYRYLEPIGRKYVLTYRCKDIFIDMDEEVEKVNKLNEMKKNEMKKNEIKNNKPIVRPQTFKSQQTSLANKKMIDIPPNRTNQTIINPINNAEMAIKDSNRYTWEGRIADFKIIKSEKKTDRNNISFKDFKKRQQQ